MTARVAFDAPVSGPAYGRGFRAFATAMLLALLAFGARVLWEQLPTLARGGGWFLGAVVFALLGTWYFMVTARTTIDAQGVRQSGLIERSTAWDEIRSACVRGPAFSRRLVVHSSLGRLRYYYGGTPDLLAAFERIAAAYPRA